MTADEMPLRYFLYGSCVSRDTYEFLPEPKTLARYIARQSLLSAGNSAVPWANELPRFKSAFQERMSQEDIVGNAFAKLRQFATKMDLLVLDLVDERGGVYTADGETFITRSIERVGSGTDESLSDSADLIAFGSPEHLALWRAAWQRLLDHLDKLGLRGRTVMLAVPWAGQSRNGESVPPSFGLTAAEGNRAFEPYYEVVRESGIPLIRPQWWATSLRAEPGHQWGLAPFHYADDIYVDLAAQLTEHARRGVGRQEAS